MAKPDPALLYPARYPFRTEVDVRFGDLDLNRHVNNVSLANFIEEGRVRFHRASGFQTAIAGLSAMVVSISTEFIGEAFYPGSITAHCGASRIGTSSYDLDLLITQDDRVVLFSRSVMICLKEGRPFSIPDSFRVSVADWMVRQ